MINVQPFLSKSQLSSCELILCMAIMLLHSSIVRGSSRENTTILSLIAETSQIIKTPQINYKISVTPEGISATPALEHAPSALISRDFPTSHTVQINGKEHTVTISPDTSGSGLIVQTLASEGAPANQLRGYPVGTVKGKSSFYVKDNSSGATFVATTNETGLNLSIQQAGNKTTDEECAGHKTEDGRCYELSQRAILGLVFGAAAVLAVIVIVLFWRFGCLGGGSGSSFSVAYVADSGEGGGCQ